MSPILEEKIPTIKGRIHTDEKIIHVGKKLMYDVNSIDAKTKYVLAHTFMKSRTKNKCREHFKKIRTTCQKQINETYEKEKHKPEKKRKLITFVSDRFGNYKNGAKYYFYRQAKIVFGVPIACKKYGLEHNNNQIERYNGDLKDRFKTRRGGFGSIAGAESFLNIKHIIHNFINPNQKLNGRTPAEAADIHLDLGRQKLLTLIRRQGEKRHHSLR